MLELTKEELEIILPDLEYAQSCHSPLRSRAEYKIRADVIKRIRWHLGLDEPTSAS